MEGLFQPNVEAKLQQLHGSVIKLPVCQDGSSYKIYITPHVIYLGQAIACLLQITPLMKYHIIFKHFANIKYMMFPNFCIPYQYSYLSFWMNNNIGFWYSLLWWICLVEITFKKCEQAADVSREVFKAFIWPGIVWVHCLQTCLKYKAGADRRLWIACQTWWPRSCAWVYMNRALPPHRLTP